MSCLEHSANVSEDVKRVISDIVTKYNLNKTCAVKYNPGSETIDGYLSKTYAVDVTDGETTLNLFLKCALDIDDIPFGYVIYTTEIYFYKTIYPTYREFTRSKGVEDGFQNVPECYGFNEARRSEILALENMRRKGYTMFDKSIVMNDEHLKLVLRTFAKFHAISFAMKDQRKELHDEFCERCPNVFTLEEVMPKETSNAVKFFIEKLDPIDDKDILNRCSNLAAKVVDQYVNMKSYLSDYSILTKGDCWLNNLMILYRNDNRELPKDVILIDWQCMTRASPVHDLGALFCSVASKETVDNYKHYLQIYHQELSKGIKEMGSDPEVLYPLSTFEKEWIDYGFFSVGLFLIAIKVILSEPQDAPTLDKTEEDVDVTDQFKNVPYDEKEYLRRTKYIARHMIDIGIF